ncbi:MAG: nitroreductase family protein [Candidatus Lokiarchaeota archaeon]|nr:nitroreductase family protein [Candidatus Lokiarchaeota archaeon]
MEASNLLAVIRYRRSVREYDPRPIEQWKVRAVLEAARLAPSSTNSQPWRILVVTDPALKDGMARATPAGINRHPWMRDAPAILVLCAVKSGVQKFAQLIGKNYHLVDMGIVGEHIVLAAAELGLGTCWVGWFHKSRVRKLLGIPLAWELVCLLPVGYPKDCSLPAGELLARHASDASTQREGEPGIGAVPAKARLRLDEVVFENKMERMKDGTVH